MLAAALPAPTTMVRPLGGGGRCGASTRSGRAASSAAWNMRFSSCSASITASTSAAPRAGATVRRMEEGSSVGALPPAPAIDAGTQKVEALAGEQQLLHLLVVAGGDRLPTLAHGGDPGRRVAENGLGGIDRGAPRLEGGKPRHARLARHAGAVEIARPSGAIGQEPRRLDARRHGGEAPLQRLIMHQPSPEGG